MSYMHLDNCDDGKAFFLVFSANDFFSLGLRQAGPQGSKRRFVKNKKTTVQKKADGDDPSFCLLACACTHHNSQK